MATASNMCGSCLRLAQRTTRSGFQRTSRPSYNRNRAYSIIATTTRPLYLDFLAPSFQAPYATSPQLACPGKSTIPSISPRNPARRTLATAAASTTAASPACPQRARAIANPRTTPEGEQMSISLSPRAAHRLSSIAAKDGTPNLALRITVESGGCHGFQYLMDLKDLSTSPATEEDTVFEGDGGAKVVLDESSLELLNGSTVDYTMELIGSQFKITGIPGATSSCGCGTSFDIKL